MERRNVDDWDQVRLEQLSKEYVKVRQQMWSILAGRLGEKWTVVEQKVRSIPDLPARIDPDVGEVFLTSASALKEALRISLRRVRVLYDASGVFIRAIL